MEKNRAAPTIEAYPRGLRNVISTQRDIGWKQFMEGLLSKDWMTYMEQYYIRQHSMRTGHKWATMTIKYLWDFIHSIWEGRNKQLHETQRIHDLSGLKALQAAIKQELQTGIGHLPASEY